MTHVGLVKLGADVTGEIVKPNDTIDANVKGIAYQLAKYGGEKGADKGAAHIGRVGEEGLKRYGSKLASAQLRTERYSTELARRFRSRKAMKVGRRSNNAKTDHAIATRALTGAQRAVKTSKVAEKAVPLVFAAWDVIDAWNDYVEDTQAEN